MSTVLERLFMHSSCRTTSLELCGQSMFYSCFSDGSDEGDPIDGNIYGSHPVYFQHKYTNGSTGRNHSTHAVYLRNTNGMDILLRNTTLQYRVIGGIFDLYFYTGPSPTDVVHSTRVLSV